LFKRIRAAIAAFVLTAALAPALAMSDRTPVAEATVAACTSFPANNIHNGHEQVTAFSGGYTGVKAEIRGGVIQTCDAVGSPHVDSNGSSAWISVDPSPGTPHGSDGNAILQIGMIYCHDPASGVNNPCDHGQEHTMRFFYAYGGCGTSPVPIDMGPVPNAGALWEFTITKTGANWGLSIPAIPSTIWIPNDYISCWSNDQKSASYEVEEWDWGDSMGIAAFTTIIQHPWTRKAVTDPWVKAPLNGGCTYLQDPAGVCLFDTLDGAGRLRLYD